MLRRRIGGLGYAKNSVGHLGFSPGVLDLRQGKRASTTRLSASPQGHRVAPPVPSL